MSDALNNCIDWMWRRKSELVNLIYERTEGVVIDGPFKGMKIVPKWGWGDGDTAGKLLGIYECEIYSQIEYEICQNHDIMLNIGCAEGYYGIGFSLKTNCQSVLFDIDPDLIDISRENAYVNKANKIIFETECTVENFRSYLKNHDRPFIIMDCEGFEEQYLDLEKIPELSKTSIIVESHDCIKNGITDTLTKRFEKTHSIEKIRQGYKNPYLEIIDDLSDYDKCILMCEGRPSTMTWLHMIPHGT